MPQQVQSVGLRGGAAAKRIQARLLLLGRFSQNASQLLALDLAELGLATLGENFRDGLIREFDDAFVEVHVLPTNLAGQQPSDGRFPGAHKAGQANARASPWFSCHWFWNALRGEMKNQTRLKMLSVPSKEVNSTFARPWLNVPNSALPQRGMK